MSQTRLFIGSLDTKPENTFPNASYTIGEGTISPFATQNTYVSFTGTNGDIGSKITVRYKVRPADHLAWTIQQNGFTYPWIGAFSTFHTKFEVKFNLVYSSPGAIPPVDPLVVPKTEEISTGDFRDDYATDMVGGYEEEFIASNFGYTQVQCQWVSIEQKEDFDKAEQ
jgi:hypothetical protein